LIAENALTENRMLPAQAGVILMIRAFGKASRNAPRAGGGDPVWYATQVIKPLYAPRAGGGDPDL